jgi:hypothetical protein
MSVKYKESRSNSFRIKYSRNFFSRRTVNRFHAVLVFNYMLN